MRYEPIKRHGLVMVFDTVKNRAHSFPKSFEEAEQEAERLNRLEAIKDSRAGLTVAERKAAA
jgi:hypothetical protein